jgi:histidinol-phosphate aminotransferase
VAHAATVAGRARWSIAGLRVLPSDANLLRVRTPNWASRVEQQLLAQGVVIRNVSRAGLLDGCRRISGGTPEENQRCIAPLRVTLDERGA